MKDKAMSGLYSKMLKSIGIGAAVMTFAMPVFYTQAQASKGDLIPIESTSSVKKVAAPLSITLGKADIVNMPDGVSDILVANPSIVDVQAVQSNRLYVVGLNIGDTNVIALDASGNVLKRLDIHVSYDLQAIQALVNKLFPEEKVEVSSIHDQILLTGTVSNPEIASKITNLVGHYVGDLQDEKGAPDELISNLIEVRGEQQVMLKVKIVEAKRNIIKELGLETAANDPNEIAVTTLFGGAPPSSFSAGDALTVGAGDGLALTQDAIGTAGLILNTGIAGIGSLGFFLNALEEENLINVLAEPNLTAVSGQQAGFLAGGEFPVPTGRDQYGNITIEFREFGVSLNFKPIVLSDDRINLQLNTEVSSLDNSNAVVLADLTVPGLDIRRAETTIEIPSGGSLMIAGLLQSQTAKGLSGLPGIKNTPILGDLMSSDSFSRDETELVVIVTAYLVDSFADKANTDHKPKEKNKAFAQIFAVNMRRNFHLKDDDSLFENDGQAYGYIIE